MKTNKLKTTESMVWLLAIVAVLSAQTALAQSERISKAGIDKLSNWVGTWEGEGWQIDQTQKRTEFKVSEVVKSELNGLAISVEGKGTSKTDGSLGHHAIGLIFFNRDTNEYVFQSLTKEGYATRSKANFNEDGNFIWGFEVPGGQIRYTISLDGDTWIEKGAYSPDGSQWYPILEMKLKKIK